MFKLNSACLCCGGGFGRSPPVVSLPVRGSVGVSPPRSRLKTDLCQEVFLLSGSAAEQQSEDLRPPCQQKQISPNTQQLRLKSRTPPPSRPPGPRRDLQECLNIRFNPDDSGPDCFSSDSKQSRESADKTPPTCWLFFIRQEVSRKIKILLKITQTNSSQLI